MQLIISYIFIMIRKCHGQPFEENNDIKMILSQWSNCDIKISVHGWIATSLVGNFVQDNFYAEKDFNLSNYQSILHFQLY